MGLLRYSSSRLNEELKMCHMVTSSKAYHCYIMHTYYSILCKFCSYWTSPMDDWLRQSSNFCYSVLVQKTFSLQETMCFQTRSICNSMSKGITKRYKLSVKNLPQAQRLVWRLFYNGGPPADLLINQGVWDNVSGHTTRAPPGRVRTDNRTVSALCHGH